MELSNRPFDALLSHAAFILLLLACDSGGSEAAANRSAASKEVRLQGSGASFPAPIYSRWFREFSDRHDNVRVNYQATGSGAGVKAFLAGQTDFGASDAAMTDEEIQAADGNVLMVPVTAGAVVLAYNLEGIENLRLSRQALTDIFLGNVTQWNDPKITETNPDASLPDQVISVVHRSDGSGTTFVFTKHLAAIASDWANGPGEGTSIDWPAGIGGRKNDGVTALIQQTPGALGYVEYAYAVTSKLPMASLENRAGRFVSPQPNAFSQALSSVRLPENLRAWVADPTGAEDYPIVTYTWLLVRKDYQDDTKARAVRELLNWCLSEGQELSESLHYVRLPSPVASQVSKAVATIR